MLRPPLTLAFQHAVDYPPPCVDEATWMRRFLRLRDVIKLTAMSKTTIYGMIKKGEFPPPAKVGRASVWTSHDVLRWQDRVLGRVDLSFDDLI